MDYRKLMISCGEPEYDRSFWNQMRGGQPDRKNMGPRLPDTQDLILPNSAGGKCEKGIAEKSVLRQIASVLTQYGESAKIWVPMSDDLAEFVPETGSISVKDAVNDFARILIGRYKLAALLRLPDCFISDASFDLEGYLVKRLAGAFAKAEDRAFISGSGTDEPTGLLHDTAGAETGVSADSLSFDAVPELFFSVKPEHRRNGVWLMNDRTALALKKMKDEAGNYLWRGSSETLLGRPVMISEYMPDPETGAKPILFGDFSWYWIVRRSPVTVRVLRELFARNDQTGYLAYEFIDGRLVRRDAVKALQITSA